MIFCQKKRNRMKVMAFLLTFVMIATMYLPYLGSVTLAAARPSMKGYVTYSYVDFSNTYAISNLQKGDSIKWSISSDAKNYVSFSKKDKSCREVKVTKCKSTSEINVYTLSQAANVVGSTYKIKATVYNRKGKRKALFSDTVIISIDAKGVEILNSPANSTINVGTKFKFNWAMDPYNSSNKTFWIITDQNDKELVNTKTGLTSNKAKITKYGTFTPLATGTYKIKAVVYRSKSAVKLRAESTPIKISAVDASAVTINPTVKPTPTVVPTKVPDPVVPNNPQPTSAPPSVSPAPSELTLNLADNVIGIDSTTTEGLQIIKSIYDSIENYWGSESIQNGGDGSSFHLIVKEDSPLMGYIDDGTYKKGDIIFIPKCEYFPNGLSLIYQSHDDQYKEGYDYDSSKYEIIHTLVAGVTDILKEGISFYTDKINQNNPIAFVVAPGNTEIYTTDEDGARNNLMENRTNTVESAGFQMQNLKDLFNPTTDFSSASNNSIVLKFNNSILYDKDGDIAEGTSLVSDNDRITLSGEVSLKNIKPIFGLDWTPSDSDPLPNQYINKLSYNENFDVNFTAGGNVGNLRDLARSYEDKFYNIVNRQSFTGLSMSGINLDGKIMLGMIGLNLDGIKDANIKTVKSSTAKVPFNPIAMIYVIMDANGAITTQLVFDYETSAYQELGINIQKEGFVGKTGSYNANAGTDNFSEEGRNFNIYDVISKSDNERDSLPVSKMTISANDDTNSTMLLGGFGGMSFGGIIPVSFLSAVGPSINGKLNGMAAIASGGVVNVEGDGCANLKLDEASAVVVNLVSNKAVERQGISWVKLLSENQLLNQDISKSKLTGKLYAYDNDEDLSNNPVLDNAKVTLKLDNDSSNPKVYEVMTANDGSFAIDNILPGKYILTIAKSGYASYITENVEITDNTQLDQNYYLVMENHFGTLSGLVTIADSDTNANNNTALAGITVRLRRLGNITMPDREVITDANGGYSFGDLPYGDYEVSVSAPDYITATSKVTINASNTSLYNVTMEAISNSNSGNGTANGIIYDALSGQGVPSGLTLKVYKGYNVITGDIVATTTTGNGGVYSLELGAGNYTVLIEDNRADADVKYKSGYFNIKVLGNKIISDQNGQVTPILSQGQIRIVLNWSQTPSDLDSHLVGPTTEGGTFHTYYSNQEYKEGDVKLVQLDVDDMESYGPETTTIYKQCSGKYKFTVHDYSNCDKDSSTALANSGAYVNVYYGDSHLTYYVPSGEGTAWDVFEYNSATGEFTVLNNMYYQKNSSNIGQQPTLRATIANTDTDSRGPLKDYEKDTKVDEKSTDK